MQEVRLGEREGLYDRLREHLAPAVSGKSRDFPLKKQGNLLSALCPSSSRRGPVLRRLLADSDCGSRKIKNYHFVCLQEGSTRNCLSWLDLRKFSGWK